MIGKKGIALPVNIIVAVVIMVVVLTAVVVYFMSGTGTRISMADADRIFYTKCQVYCDNTDNEANRNLVVEKIQNQDAEFLDFLEACEMRGIPWRDSSGEIPLRCLAACPCDVSLTAGEARSNTNCAASCLDACEAGDAACLRLCMASC